MIGWSRLKNEWSGWYEESSYDGSGRETDSWSFQKSRVLEMYWLCSIGKLPMGIKDASFGLRYQNILLTRHLLNYKEMFVGTLIYISYVVISIILLYICCPLNYFILHKFVHFLDVSFITYLSLSLTDLRYIPDKV